LAIPNSQSMTVLGIESSCDDTSVALIKHKANIHPQVLSLIVLNQNHLHKQYGGIVPEIAARAHSDKLDYCTIEALRQANSKVHDIDLVSVTAGPGLIGGVLSGVAFAKGLSWGIGIPIVGVNHLAAHALSPGLTTECHFPYLCLLISGGHCQFLAVLSPKEYRRLGGTIDDAPGEAFDKTARHLGLPQPGGPSIEKLAKNGVSDRYHFPRPLTGREGCDLSFSGLKTAFLREVEKIHGTTGSVSEQQQADLCASFQKAVSDTLRIKSQTAITQFETQMKQKPTFFALTGGVAANHELRGSIEALCHDNGIKFYAPPLKYCTDNGAMIAWAGLQLFYLGQADGLELQARSRWPLDPNSRPLLGFGKKGAKA